MGGSRTPGLIRRRFLTAAVPLLAIGASKCVNCISVDEADKLFALLNGAAIPDGRWRVSMLINRLELLLGKPDAAAALV